MPSLRLECLRMKTLIYKGVQYKACAPSPIGNGRYKCDAWKTRNGREISNHETLHALGIMLIRAKEATT